MKISIITITYNAGQFLEKTMLSVLQQTKHSFEYILIDGNSNDKTVDIIKDFEKRISNHEFPGVDASQFKWISEPDQGLYDAMNKGINLSTGDFVWFINAGDKIYAANTLEQVEDLLDIEPECDFIYGQSMMIDQNDIAIGERHKIAPRVIHKSDFLKGLVICHQSVIVHKKIAPQYNLEYRITSDYDWMIRAVENSDCQGYINQYISKFMIAGISSQNHIESWKERFHIMKKHFGLLPTLWAHIVIILKYPFTRKY